MVYKVLIQAGLSGVFLFLFSATGCIQSLNDIRTWKNGNTDYFNVVLQEKPDKFYRVVCFSPNKRKLFADAEENKSPVSIFNISRSSSKQRKFSHEIKVFDDFTMNDSGVDFPLSSFEGRNASFKKLEKFMKVKEI